MFKRLFSSLLIGTSLALILSGAFYLGIFNSWQERLSDNLFLPKKAPDNIVIIAIDDKSLQTIGRWPWDRSVHADLINKLNSAYTPPRAIGVDVSFLENSDPQNDQKLADVMASNIVLASEYNDGIEYKPIDILAKRAKHGIANTLHDPDGITRRLNPINSFSLEIAKVYNPNVVFPDPYPIRINFVGKPYSFKTVSYSDVLNSNIDMNMFGDKIVLIGATAADLHDNQIVPTSNGTPMPGVEIHASAITTILEGSYLTEEPTDSTIFTIFVVAILLSLILTQVRIKIGATATGLALFTYFVYSIISFDQGIITNLVYPPLAILGAFIASIIYKYVTETKQKRFLRRAFSHYLSEEVINEIVANPEKLKLGGEKREVTVLFSDIQGFTTISENTDPEKLTSLINDYLSAMTEVVLKHKGVVDKFIGDSVMAFWGAPLDNQNHALDACRAALEMSKVHVGEFTTRIGINTGEAIVGNMGSSTRFDYTVLGDTVNTASRLEGTNKEYKTNILISESTYKLVKDDVKARLVDTVTVRGKTKSLKVYELLGIRS